MSWLISRALFDNLSESLPSSQAQAVASLGDTFSGGAASVQLSETDTPPPFWLRDKTTKVSRLSQFGMTFVPSTGDLGEALLTSYRAGFPVRTSAPLEKAQELMVRNRAFGANMPVSSIRFDHASSTWKTAQYSLQGDLEPFSETWPRWGMMRGGACWELPTPSGVTDLRRSITNALASGSSQSAPTPTVCGNYNRKGVSKTSGDGLSTWVTQRMQTPVADDGVNRLRGKINSRGEPKLSAQALRMPTPACSDAHRGGVMTEAMTGQSLVQAVNSMSTAQRVPTPTASASKGSSPGALTRKTGRSRENARIDHYVFAKTLRLRTPNATDADKWSLQTEAERREKGQQVRLGHQIGAGGQLNPEWVEWLMGWPIGWTALEPLAMGRFQQWSRSVWNYSRARASHE